MRKLVKNSLGFDSDLYVYQDKDMFNYSVDTILLGNFVTLNSTTKRMLEVGTNNGALSIFVSERSKNLKIDAIEIQEQALEVAKMNLEMNNKQEQINLIHADFNEYWKAQNKAQAKKYDVIVCNPPFYKKEAQARKQGNESIYIATHEVALNLEQLIAGSAKLIKQKGYLAIVEPTERLVDLFELLRKYNFEPKRVQMVHPREDAKSNLVLVEARFHVGYGTHFLPNIYLHPQDSKLHDYRDEVKALYKPIKVKER